MHVVVSGAPATGKSTVAAALGHALGLTVLSLDVIKEALADSLGLGDEDWSNTLGDAAAETVFRLARDGAGNIAEGWWRGARRTRAVEVFAGRVEVFCTCEPGVAVARATARLEAARHPGHRDVINPRMLDPLAGIVAAAAPLGVGDQLVEVDTTTGFYLDAIVEVLRRGRVGGI